jgi:hypothetical protein
MSKITNFLGFGALALLLLSGGMVVTKPTKSDYVKYASTKLATELKKAYCKESKVPKFLQDFAGMWANACETGLTTRSDLIRQFLDSSTKEQDYLILSIYQTEVANYKYETLGAFGNFFTYSGGKQKTVKKE